MYRSVSMVSLTPFKKSEERIIVIIPFLAVKFIIGGSIFNYLLFLYHLIFRSTVSAVMLFTPVSIPV